MKISNPLIKFDKPGGEDTGFSLQINLGWLVPMAIAAVLLKMIIEQFDSDED